MDKKSGATTARPGLTKALAHLRDDDVVVAPTFDRLGRTARDTLSMIHDLAQRGIGVRNLADPIRMDSSNPSDPMSQLTIVVLALFAQMERTAHTRAVATATRADPLSSRRKIWNSRYYSGTLLAPGGDLHQDGPYSFNPLQTLTTPPWR